MGDGDRALLTGVVALLISIGLVSSACAPAPNPATSQIAAQGLVKRLLPEQADRFVFEAFQLELLQWERDWADQRETYPTEPHGDSLVVARKLWEKYGGRF